MIQFEKISLSENSYLLLGEAFSQDSAEKVKKDILKNSQWRDDKITFFGKTFDQPRKVDFVGDSGTQYTYSKIKMTTRPWEKGSRYLRNLRDLLSQDFSLEFNTCLVNYYRNGHDHMSWHCDNEKELGENPVIACVRLGAERDFLFKPKKNTSAYNDLVKLKLYSGSLLIMQGETQNEFYHSLPKRMKVRDDRVNLTFRKVYEESFEN